MKQVLQIENVNAQDFKNEILSEIKKMIVGSGILQNQQSQEQLLTVEQVCKLFCIGKTTLWSWTKKGFLISYKIGNRILYKESEVLDALQNPEKKI